jgi:tRNA modification GTPase
MSAIGEAVAVSSVTGDGLGALVGRLAHEIGARCDAGAGLLATVRQLRELSRLRRCLERAAEQLRSQPLEVALVDLHEALGAVSEVLGITAADDVLDRIFSTFCLGK